MRTGIRWNNSCPTKHFYLNSHEPRTLHDSIVVVVCRRRHRARQAASDATFEEAAIGGPVAGPPVAPAAWISRLLILLGAPPARIRRQFGDASVWRGNDKRGSFRRDLLPAI